MDSIELSFFDFCLEISTIILIVYGITQVNS